MTKHKKKAYPLRLDSNLREKIEYISKINYRNLSLQFEKILTEYVEKWEEENGEIKLENEEE